MHTWAARSNAHVSSWRNSHVSSRSNAHVSSSSSAHVCSRSNAHVSSRRNTHVSSWSNAHVSSRCNTHVSSRRNVHLSSKSNAQTSNNTSSADELQSADARRNESCMLTLTTSHACSRWQRVVHAHDDYESCILTLTTICAGMLTLTTSRARSWLMHVNLRSLLKRSRARGVWTHVKYTRLRLCWCRWCSFDAVDCSGSIRLIAETEENTSPAAQAIARPLKNRNTKARKENSVTYKIFVHILCCYNIFVTPYNWKFIFFSYAKYSYISLFWSCDLRKNLSYFMFGLIFISSIFIKLG